MRYGIFSDIHGNLEALNVVLKSLQKEKVDTFLCLGDVVGYGSNPDECVEIVRDLKPVIVAGNHDFAVAGLIDFNYFNKWAKSAVYWTQNKISNKAKNFLKGLEIRIEHPECTFVHGSPYSPEQWIYVLTIKDALKCFLSFDSWICFIGHSHCPFIYELDRGQNGKVIFFNLGEEIELKKDSRYVINAGSVGQPRDGDKRACYMVFDTETKKIIVNRIEYNYKLTQKKIIEAGLPVFLAERLESGK